MLSAVVGYVLLQLLTCAIVCKELSRVHHVRAYPLLLLLLLRLLRYCRIDIARFLTLSPITDALVLKRTFDGPYITCHLVDHPRGFLRTCSKYVLLLCQRDMPVHCSSYVTIIWQHA